jgi:hypothetical protein
LLLLGLALSDVAADEGLLGVQGLRDDGSGMFYLTFQMSNSKVPKFYLGFIFNGVLNKNQTQKYQNHPASFFDSTKLRMFL